MRKQDSCCVVYKCTMKRQRGQDVLNALTYIQTRTEGQWLGAPKGWITKRQKGWSYIIFLCFESDIKVSMTRWKLKGLRNHTFSCRVS